MFDKLEKPINKVIGSKTVILESVDSTNSYAKKHSELQNGTVIVANHQISGRGRMGRNFSSDNSDGLWFSILVKPDISPVEIMCLTLITGLSVSRAIGSRAKIKWPNDIILNDKKICGILTEMGIENNKISYAVVGIGINLNQKSFDLDLKDIATSLRIETGQKYEKSDFMNKVLEIFEMYYNYFIEYGFSEFVSEYEKKCITVNSDVRLIKNCESINAHAIGISNDGGLKVLIDGKQEIVKSMEVSVR